MIYIFLLVITMVAALPAYGMASQARQAASRLSGQIARARSGYGSPKPTVAQLKAGLSLPWNATKEQIEAAYAQYIEYEKDHIRKERASGNADLEWMTEKNRSDVYYKLLEDLRGREVNAQLLGLPVNTSLRDIHAAYMQAADKVQDELRRGAVPAPISRDLLSRRLGPKADAYQYLKAEAAASGVSLPSTPQNLLGSDW